MTLGAPNRHLNCSPHVDPCKAMAFVKSLKSSTFYKIGMLVQRVGIEMHKIIAVSYLSQSLLYARERPTVALRNC